jgi:6,7-dimethyl-8-ribityllumazine synthase
VANGILTTDDEKQASARLDKGAEAVRVAVEMARLKLQLHETR